MSRKILAYALVAGSLTGCQTHDVPRRIVFGPLLGDVGAEHVKVWVRATSNAPLDVAYWSEASPARVEHAKLEPRADHDSIATTALTNLRPSTRYLYEIESDDGNIVHEPTSFHTLPKGSGRSRFAVGGDVYGSDVPGFDAIRATSPDFVFMVGDNVYADGSGKTFSDYRARYETVWGGYQFQELFSQIPAFRIWDDHELVDNYWNGKNDAIYPIARALYDDYQGSMNPAPIDENELYYAFVAAGVSFFVLDTRSHRSPNSEADGPEKTMLGAEQLSALENWLATDQNPVHVLVSSVIMSRFSTTGTDSWNGFSNERDKILAMIARLAPQNLVVVSGDQHWSAVLRHDAQYNGSSYPFYEVEATPLGFSERVEPGTIDESVVALDNTHRVFGLLDVDTTSDEVTVDFTLCDVARSCSPPEPAPSRARMPDVPYTVRFRSNAGRLEIEPF